VATIVYLDAEDEITSAAARIRAAADSRVAVVIPFGSRVATSRINFRLLAREAMVNGKRLDIVAPDASARALAASAGIGVFASVGEYESALDGPPDAATDPTPAGDQDRGPGATTATLVGAAGGAAGAAGAAAGAAGATRPGTPGTTGTPTARPATGPAARLTAEDEAELEAVVRRSRHVPVVKPRRRIRRGLLASLLVLALGTGVAAVAAYLFLPAAEITVTPQVQPVGPISLTITADPAATAVDPQNLVIPATTVTIPVEVSAEFPATGVRAETKPAKGGVRWKNCDPSAPYTIPRGTVVRTPSGIGFRIDEQVFLPVAVISGGGTNVNLQCQTSEVSVTAVDEGPEGNVGAGTIRVVPARYNRNLITVTNPAATTGGSREEFKRVSRKDVEGALASLNEDLQAEWQLALENPDVPEGAAVFPETAVLGEATPTPDPETLIGQEVDSFTLGLTAAGTVTAVDSTPVQAIADAALAEAVDDGSELVPDSTTVDVGVGTVAGEVITFDVTGSAKQLRPVDAATLLPQVLGLTEAEARAVLEPYGEVGIALWPGWVTTIPTFERRVSLEVADPIDTIPTPSPTAEPTATPEPEPSAEENPDGEPSGEPVPSG
jgi:hypothetical protein